MGVSSLVRGRLVRILETGAPETTEGADETSAHEGSIDIPRPWAHHGTTLPSRFSDMPVQKVIYDTDPGVDDAMALFFLHHHPDIDLIGITTGHGNASVETTTRNALYLKERFGISRRWPEVPPGR